LFIHAKDLFVGAKQAGRTAPPPPVALAPGSAVEMQHDMHIVGQHQRLDAPAYAAQGGAVTGCRSAGAVPM
jgi:hypothetical protein